MDKQLLLLISLQELDILRKEKKGEEEVGFEIDNMKKMEEARASIVSQIKDHLYRKYSRLTKRYGSAVVPVVNNICQGCYLLFPTQMIAPEQKNKSVITCPNCGRILYWID
ncbi:MAG: C4-type zinc ribbon domain-containing protein [candidate division WOR-3 bacterium]